MIGVRYWSTGITVKWSNYDGSWAGTVEYFDDGFCKDSVAEARLSTEGRLSTRYWVRPSSDGDALTVIIDTLIRDAERLDIEWRFKNLYYSSDGENSDYPPPPNWRDILKAQAERIGWETYVDIEEPALDSTR